LGSIFGGKKGAKKGAAKARSAAQRKAAKEFQKDYKQKRRRQVAQEKQARADLERANLTAKQTKDFSDSALLAQSMAPPEASTSTGSTQIDRFG
jgi:hypothetical protein